MKCWRVIPFCLVALGAFAETVVEAGRPQQVAICHQTHSGANPRVLIHVSASSVAAHLKQHGDFLWDPALHDERCNAVVKCGGSPELAARSCSAILEACGPEGDGVYWINPSGM